MRFTPQFLDELRARLPVSEVVGKRVKLVRSGREFKGLSPFNKEKTPSFFVNDQKQAWFDFSSGKNGSIFDFVMLTDGVAFPEAVERLAQMAGVPLPKVSAQDEAREQKRKTLHDVMELAAKFFADTLAARAGAKARGYLADRGIDAATQLKFRLGYAAGERFALKEHLGSHGVPVEDMVEAGLLVTGDDIPVPFDRFRDRVMFPITDLRGRVIAFGGRALEKDAPAKYLNSPETPLFHKGATLYHLAAARQAALAAKSTQAAQENAGAHVIAVEGYVDVIAMVTAGFPATVAPLGTALTEDQLALLWKMADEPMLCFDGDAAGQRAAFRAVDLALPRLAPGKSLKFAMLPPGQDPDDLARSGGRDAIADVIGAARPLAAMLWARETEGHSFDTPERRAALEARINAVTGQIGDNSVRKYYRQDFNARVAALFAPAQSERGRGQNWRQARPRLAQSRPRRLAPAQRAAANARRQSGTLCGGQPATRNKLRASRPPLGGVVARGADPAGRAQSSLAAARPPGGVRLARVPPSRRRAAQRCADRHRRPCRGDRCRGHPGGACHPQPGRGHGAHRGLDHHRLGLGGRAGGRPRRRSGDLATAGRLASAVAFTN